MPDAFMQSCLERPVSRPSLKFNANIAAYLGGIGIDIPIVRVRNGVHLPTKIPLKTRSLQIELFFSFRYLEVGSTD